MSSLVMSLDFELFWGVSDSRRINDYRQNVEGVWIAIPKMLALFRQYDIHATWAAVGMLMCVVGDVALRQDLGGRARASVLARYELQAVLRQWDDVFRQVGVAV